MINYCNTIRNVLVDIAKNRTFKVALLDALSNEHHVVAIGAQKAENCVRPYVLTKSVSNVSVWGWVSGIPLFLEGCAGCFLLLLLVHILRTNCLYRLS